MCYAVEYRDESTLKTEWLLLGFAGVMKRGDGVSVSEDVATAASDRGKKQFACKFCNKSYTMKHNLSLHKRNIHGEDAGPFKCPFCLSIYKNRHTLRSHIYYAHKEPQSPLRGEPEVTITAIKKRRAPLDSDAYECSECGKQFKHHGSLYHHVHSTHGAGAQQVMCNICNGIFKNLRSLKHHQYRTAHANMTAFCTTTYDNEQQEAANPSKPFVCTSCFQRFTLASNLSRHKSNFHGKNAQTSHCPHCSLLFKNKRSLDSHVRNLGISDYQLSAWDTQGHKNTSQGASADAPVPFQCPWCNKSYSSATGLSRHKANAHGKFAHSVTCSVCNGTYKNQQTLKAHFYRNHKNKH
ncbi:hypothetical protein B566_EDAN018143 [Ephemera danica]|nr:hypothetical protein B566_EDAN018143 [Ephemera danica]